MVSIQQKRLSQEIKMIGESKELTNMHIYVDESNLNRWYYLIYGLGEDKINKEIANSHEINEHVYKGGHYIGEIVFDDKYPATPPEFYFRTPSGRFEPDKKICVTYSKYHADQWSPITTVLQCVLAMVSLFREDSDSGISHIVLSGKKGHEKQDKKLLETRAELAKKSIKYNQKHWKDIYDKLLNEHINGTTISKTVKSKSKEEPDSDVSDSETTKKKKSNKKSTHKKKSDSESESESESDKSKKKSKKKNKKEKSNKETTKEKSKKSKKNKTSRKKSDSDSSSSESDSD